jgi:hypothetical protein
MRGPLAILFGLALAAFTSGCRSCDRVESELRARENDLREARAELERSDAYNQALQAELRAVRGEICPLPGEQPVVGYPVRALVLGRQTGGRDSDSGRGDDALQVVLEPRDPEGQSIKVPGMALVQVLEVTPEGLKRPLSTWEISPEELRKSWRSSLLGTGYFLTLPWKIPPATEKLRVVAQFRLTDGRMFEADKDVTVRLPPSPRRPMPPADDTLPPTRERDVLPPPQPVDPPKPPPPDPTGPSLDPSARGQPSPTEPGAPVVWRAVRPPTPPVVPAAQILKPVLLHDSPR